MPLDILANGRIATLKKARREHICHECEWPIRAGENYYHVTFVRSGLGLKFPKRVHECCIDAHLESG